MTDYHSHIHGFEDSFKRLDSHTVRIIKRLIPKGAGIRRLEDGTVVLRSHSLSDILDAVRFRKWSHTRMPHGIESGTKIIVIPNQEQCELYGDDFVFGIEFTASGPAYRESDVDEVWSSELTA